MKDATQTMEMAKKISELVGNSASISKKNSEPSKVAALKIPLDEHILNELTALRVEVGLLKEGVALVSNQMQYITQLNETIVEQQQPCAEREENRNESLEGIKQMLKNSPLNKHPMFRDLLKPLEEMLEKQKA